MGIHRVRKKNEEVIGECEEDGKNEGNRWRIDRQGLMKNGMVYKEDVG